MATGATPFGSYFVYVLRNPSGNFYTGCTSNLKKRLGEHDAGLSTYSRSHGPYKLLYYEVCTNAKDAFAREKYLKSGLGKRYLKNRLKYYLESEHHESR
jgi:putative endonuclease